jgi:hypothetical protein
MPLMTPSFLEVRRRWEGELGRRQTTIKVRAGSVLLLWLSEESLWRIGCDFTADTILCVEAYLPGPL